MRRCYQIALQGIPQAEWDLHDYLDIVRMWNMSKGNLYDPTLDHDEKGLYVKCRREGTLLLGLTHDLLPFQVYGKGLDDLIRVDHGAAIRWQKRLEPFTSAASLATEVIRKEILAEMERRVLTPKLHLDLMKTRPGTQSGRMSWSVPITADPGPMTRWYEPVINTFTIPKGSTT